MPSRIEAPYQGRLKLYAGEFRRGPTYTNWRPHGTPDWLLIYTSGGAGRITSAGGSFATRAGECILYAPGNCHDYRTDPRSGRWHLLWSHFLPRAGWQPWLVWPQNAQGIRSLYLDKGEVRGAFAAAMRRAIRALRRRLPNAADFAANALEEALLWVHLAASRDDWVRLDPRVRKAMDYLAENVRQPFQLEALARHCGLSVSRLAHLFKSETSVSPQRFFEEQRMRQAGQLLRVTGLRIGEVAAEVGYDDPFYFANRFRRYAGKSPTEFRRHRPTA